MFEFFFDLCRPLSVNTITLQETDSGTDSDSDPIPVVGSFDWNLNLTNVQCENLCIVQCSHWVWSPNLNLNPSPNPAV